MSVFAMQTEDGGAGSYETGLIVLPDGRRRGIETVTGLAVRDDAPPPPLSDLLGTLRGALPGGGTLPGPMRLVVSTMRAGLGLIEEGLSPGGTAPVTVEIAFADGECLVARMPPDLVALLRRDRATVAGALARAAAPAAAPDASEPPADAPTEALTSIFRYEKRNGRLRRVSGPDRTEE